MILCNFALTRNGQRQLFFGPDYTRKIDSFTVVQQQSQVEERSESRVREERGQAGREREGEGKRGTEREERRKREEREE